MHDLLIVKWLCMGHERRRQLPFVSSESLCRVELISYLGYSIELVQLGFFCILILRARNACFIALIFPVLASIDSEMEALTSEPVSMYSVLKLDRISHVSAHVTITQL